MKRIYLIIIFLLIAAGAAPARGEPGELTLNEALKIAQQNNPTVEQLKAAVWQSQNTMRQARAAYWPTLDYQFETSAYLDDYTLLNVRAPLGDFTNSLSFSYTLYNAGRRPTLSSSKFALEASRMDYERYLEQLQYSVHSAFLSAYLAREGRDVALESQAFFEKLRRDAKVRFDEGLIPESDYLTFANSYDQAVVTASGNGRDFKLAVLALEGLLHQPVEGALSLNMAEIAGTDSKVAPENLVEIAMLNRKDLSAARARLFSMKAAFKAAGKSKLPVAALNVAYQNEANDIDEIGFDDDVALITGTVSWRLSDGRKRTFLTLEQEARVQQIEAQVKALEWQVRSDVMSAWHRTSAAAEQLEVLENTVKNAEKNLDIITKRYKEGLITVSEVTDAELSLSRARLNRLSALVNLSVGRHAMKLAIGGGQ